MNQKFTVVDIRKITEVLTRGCKGDPCYMSGPQLVDFFNDLGYEDDDYDFNDGGIKIPDRKNDGFNISRKEYVKKRLTCLNEDNKICDTLNHYIEISNDKENSIVSLDEILTPKGFTFIDGWISKIDDLSSPKKDDYNELSSKQSEKFVVEKIYNGNNQEWTKLKVFISYSWDSYEHKVWVKKFANDLKDIVQVIYDQESCEPGQDLINFMDDGIESADKVLIIGTPMYKKKAELNTGGVKYEQSIIKISVYNDAMTSKFIPILKEGDFTSSFPKLFWTRKGYDFSKNYNFAMQQLKEYLLTLIKS